ncbi:MAG: hypothetical protein CVU18_18495 [Betaproteobacteria bacterium HGW-Betaproteobacteria-12]|nr:MAG: hypothetical protein CVU18_18495 [Betaproteobacteria bacterium HGW-Betaproteobacteria-12]
MAQPRRLGDILSPVTFTFATSLLLSIIAVTSGNLNRDGMLYVETARAFIDGGLTAAIQVFSWPFLPVLMGLLAELTGLPPEWCGHALNVLFMSGACALLVDLVRRNDPQLAWLAAVVVLALPGLNDYRNELIREYGCWFFLLLAFRLAIDWPARPGWRRALAIQASLLLAALFRPEVLVFYPCLVLWQHFRAAPEKRWSGSLMLGALPALGLLVLLAAYFTGALGGSSRLANELARFDFLGRFDATASAMSQAFNAYAREEAETAHTILFFGSLALIPWKFIGKLGIFVIPLLAFLLSHGKAERYRRHDLLLWALGGYLLILAIFVLQQQFISGRYLGLLLMFTLPFVAYGVHDLVQRFPRSWLPILGLCLLLALANVVSLKPGKQHFAAAGSWLHSQYVETPRIYLDSARTAHYASWKFTTRLATVPREKLLADVLAGRYDVVILEVSRKDSEIGAWAGTAGLAEVQRFADRNGDAIVVYVPTGRSLPPTTASSKASSRAPTTADEYSAATR